MSKPNQAPPRTRKTRREPVTFTVEAQLLDKLGKAEYARLLDRLHSTTKKRGRR